MLSTTYFTTPTLPDEYQPYVELFTDGFDMQTADILAVYARPAYSELWVIFSRLSIEVHREFNRKISKIYNDVMPVLLEPEDLIESNIPSDAIPLEVN